MISRNAFYPKPNVDSAVVIFTKKIKKIKILNESLFFKLVKDSFDKKRKTLKNNLKDYNLDKINEVLNKHNKNINNRAETITIEEFAEISNFLT